MKGCFVRFLRFVALLLTVALAYSAQLILHPPLLSTSASFLPPQFQELIPDLSRLRALVAGDLRDVAFFVMALAAVSFGHLTAPWALTEPPLSAAPTALFLPGTRRRQRVSWFVISSSLLPTLAAGLLFRAQALNDPTAVLPETTATIALIVAWVQLPPPLLSLVQQTPWLPIALWVGGLFLFIVGCALFPWVASAREAAEATATPPSVKQTMASWPLLLLLLFLATLLYSWRLLSVPPTVDIQVAEVGLVANQWLRNGEIFFLWTGYALEPGLQVAGLAATVPALLLQVTNDLLLSIRLTGIGAALLTLIATWLLGTELFRRVPGRLSSELGEDHGQWPALLATLLVTFMVAMLLFSRLPSLLETVAWGSLGGWALLRGLRTGDRLAVGLSSVLIGLSAVLYTPGWTFVLMAFSWWLAYWVLQAGWLPHRLQPQGTASCLRGDFFLWLLGFVPTLGVRWVAFGQWLPLLQGNWRAHWQPTLLAFGQQGDLSQLGGLNIPLLHDLVAPLFVLAVGALYFNLDRRVGWMLLTWLGSGLLYAMLLTPTTPIWPAFAPLLPAIGLALAFGLDRLRITILKSVGRWTHNLLSYLILGLILWVGLNNVVKYYDFAQQQADPISALGHELRIISDQPNIFVIASPVLSYDAPQLRFLTNDWMMIARTAVTFGEGVPENAPAGTVILLTPSQAALLPALQARYPSGSLLVRRDHLANPLLYRYTVSTE